MHDSMHNCFRCGFDDHVLMKAHGRISIKDYSRGSNLQGVTDAAAVDRWPVAYPRLRDWHPRYRVAESKARAAYPRPPAA